MYMTSAIRKTLQFWFQRPLHLIALQIPAGLAPLVNDFIPTGNAGPWQMALSISFFLPLLVALTCVSTGATFVSLKSPSPMGLKETFAEVLLSFRTLFLGTLIVTILVFLGIPLFLLGVYFSAIYLFVPHEILSEPGLGVSAALSRSKRLARTHLWSSLGVAIMLLLVDLGILFVGTEQLAAALSEGFTGPPRAMLIFTIKTVVTILVGGTVNSFLGYYYLEMKEAVRK